MVYNELGLIAQSLSVSPSQLDRIATDAVEYGRKRKKFTLGDGVDQWEYTITLCRIRDQTLGVKLVVYTHPEDDQLGVNMEVAIPTFDRIYRSYGDRTVTRIRDDDTSKREERHIVLCHLKEISNLPIIDGKFTIQMKAVVSFNYFKTKYSSPLSDAMWECEDKDFVIVVGKKDSEEKTEIEVHKLVISARSPVFERMLQTDMVEKCESKVDIVDFDAEVVQLAIEFCYDRCIYLGREAYTLFGLLHFADKYEIKDLQEKVEHVLKFHIFSNTIVEIANVSIATNSHLLKKFCCEFLKFYIKNDIPYDDSEILDKDFAVQMLQWTSGGSVNNFGTPSV